MTPGWQLIGPHPAIAAWATAALPVAQRALADSAEPLRFGGTWAVGLDLLANDPSGAVAGCAFPWQALPMAAVPLHPGQVSAVYPGYPQPFGSESDAAYRYALRRDAAHLDGLMAVGPQKRRMVKEPHAWILGLPLTAHDTPAAPLVVWEGSHALFRAAFWSAFGDGLTAETDLTEVYTATRAQVFETCRRVEVAGPPGTAILLHRMTLHGVAPWQPLDQTGGTARLIAYFRPQCATLSDWIRAD